MDKKQLIGVLIIVLMYLGFTYFVPKPEPQLEETAKEQIVAQVASTIEAKEVISDSLQQAINQKTYGLFGEAASGIEQNYILENEDIKVTFSNKGALIERVELKKYKTWDKRPVILMDKEHSSFGFNLITLNGTIDFANLYFNTSAPSQTTVSSGEKSISFKLEVEPGRFIEQVYTLPTNGYQIKNRFDVVGMDQIITGSDLAYTWKDGIIRQEEVLDGGSGERANSTVNYFTVEDSFDNLSKTGEDQESIESPLKWFSFKQHFFTTAIIAENSMKSANFSIVVPDETDTTIVKNFTAKFVVSLSDLKTQGNNFTFFFGPNNYELLQNVTLGFNDNVDLGWPVISWVNKFVVIPVFNFLQEYISSYGLIIFILVVLIKLVLFPLSFKSYMSMAKMKALKPEIDKIKEENNGDMTKVQMRQMELYKQVGVSPLSGCVPMLLQMPILFAMFRFFPNSIELRGQSFLWAHDLSTYDVLFTIPELPFIGSHISGFCLLMTASTLAYTWSNNQMSNVDGPMKSIQYMMPLMFFFVLNSFPAGLTYYYFLSNIVTLGQQAIIRRFVDEDKIREKLDENRKKNKTSNKKKSGFQQRLEDAMKASQDSKKNKKK